MLDGLELVEIWVPVVRGVASKISLGPTEGGEGVVRGTADGDEFLEIAMKLFHVKNDKKQDKLLDRMFSAILRVAIFNISYEIIE